MSGSARGALRAGIGLLVSVVCIVLTLRGVDLARTVELLRQASPAWLALAVLAVCADLSFRGLRWQRLLAPISHVPFRRLMSYMLVGYLANNVLPARLGEVVRSHYLGDREGISRSATLGTVVVERVIDTVVLVAIAALAILILHVRGVVASAVLVGLALAALLVVGLAVALAAHRLPGAARASAFLARWPRVVGIASRIRDGLRVAALPRTVAAAALLSVAAWSCTVLAVLAAGQALGIQLSTGEGALLAAGTNLATAVPSGPGYLGTFEYAGQSIAAAFGLARASGLALALLVHVVTIAVSSLGGAVALIRLGWSHTRQLAEAGDLSERSGATEAAAPGVVDGVAAGASTSSRAAAGRGR